MLGLPRPGQARLISRMLGLRSQEDWYAFVEDDPVSASVTVMGESFLWYLKLLGAVASPRWQIQGLRSLRLPALPSIYYKSEWKGYEVSITFKHTLACPFASVLFAAL